MLEHNPTRTKTITENWFRDINRRWKKFTSATTKELNDQNKSSLATNAEFKFELDASQIRTYMVFFQSMIDELLLGSVEPPNWQAEYQLQSYTRGLERARASLISQGADLVPTAAESFAAQGLTSFTATSTLGLSASLGPIHQDALEFLYIRSFNSMKKWTDAMTIETRGILFDAVAQGKGIREVTDEIVDRIDVSRSRAQLIARTETIQAYQRGSINEVIRAGGELDETLNVRWISALAPGRTRELHWQWHGDIITTEEANRRIGVSPWNCLCAIVPVIETPSLAKKNEKFAEEKKRFNGIETNSRQIRVNSIMHRLS